MPEHMFQHDKRDLQGLGQRATQDGRPDPVRNPATVVYKAATKTLAVVAHQRVDLQGPVGAVYVEKVETTLT